MRRRILLADDSVTIQKVIELTFMDEDYDVKAVSNGDEALAALSDVKPDVVIADVHMPGANGYEVCRRSKEIRPHVPVLLLVGTFEPFDEGQARAAGADSFLKKPFDSQELLQRVQDLIASRSGAAPAVTDAPPSLDMDLGAALPPLDLGAFDPAPAFAPPPAFEPAAQETDWSAFQLEPEPAPAFSAPEPFEPFPAATPEPRLASPFLEEEASPFVLEDDRSTTAFAPEAFPMEESTPPPLPQAAGFAAPWETEAAPEERLGVPESAVPLVDSLAETEARIEAAPSPFGAVHEPESAPAWSAPVELAPLPWGAEPEPTPWSPPPAPPVEEEAPLFKPLPMPVSEPPAAEPLAAEPAVSEPAVSEPAVASFAAPVPVAGHEYEGNGHLSEEDVDRIARRVVELMGDKAVRDIAWEVIPDLAEVVIRSRLRELEAQVENPAE